MVATGKLHVVNVKTSEMVAQGFEVENVMDKTEVLFDLGMAGIVPIDQARAIDVAKKKLVIGFDRQFFETLAVFNPEFDVARFGFGQDFFEDLFYTLKDGFFFCVALLRIFSANLFVFGRFALTTRDEIEELVGIVFHFNRPGMKNNHGRLESGGEFNGLQGVALC